MENLKIVHVENRECNGKKLMGDDIVIDNNVVGFVEYDIDELKKTIYIKNFLINSDCRKRKIGTLSILELKKLYPGFLFWGEILYEIAFEFWKSLKDKVTDLTLSSDEFTYNVECVYFEFK